MSEHILIARVNGVATITFNRPEKRNALNGKMINEISHALQLIREDKDMRVLILQGNGDNFCAGADIQWMKTVSAGIYQENYEDAQTLADLLFQLYSFPKPTIALIHGATLGGGIGLLAACDIAIAAENATFSFSEVKLGVTPSVISPYVISAIGEREAHYYFLTGDRFVADIAQQIGLVHHVVGDDVLLHKGATLAKIIMQNSPNALTEAKRLIRHVSKEKISTELSQKTAEHLATLRSTPEAQEGLRAFIEKRTPVWSE